MTAKTRIHAALLRLEALSDEARGERSRAAELLSRALTAAPDDLLARLELARVLHELGRTDQARGEVQAALRTAEIVGLSASAINEIRALP